MKRTIRIILSILIMVMLGTVSFSDTAHAEEIAGGSCGENVNWSVDDTGRLTISGNGPMYDQKLTEPLPWEDYIDSIYHLTIENGVTHIGENLFWGNKNITSVEFPESVTSIGSFAFYYCVNLKEIKTTENLTSIDTLAFSNCGIVTAGPKGGGYDYEFEWTESIPDNAFSDGYSLTSVTIPSTITSIGTYAFGYCQNLPRIIIPEGVERIESFAFQACSSLSYISLPESLTEMGRKIFTELFKGDMPPLYTAGPTGGGYDIEFAWKESIPAYAFEDDILLTSIEIPETITSIGSYAFSECKSLEKIVIPASVTELGIDLFNMGPHFVTAGPIGGGYDYEFGWTETIPAYAFHGCSYLEKIVIPETIQEVEIFAFLGADSLETAGPIGGGYNYEFGWTDCLAKNAFNYVGISSITLPEELTTIGDGSFYECVSLRSIDIPDGVTRIENNAFRGCRNIEALTLPENLTYIGDNAFRYCNALPALSIPAGVTYIGSNAFERARNMKELTFLGDAPFIGENAFLDIGLVNYYPVGNETWTEEYLQAYGGRITWNASCGNHSFQTEPTYTWSENNETCTASLNCKHEGCEVAEVSETVNSTVETQKASCTEEGLRKYQAKFRTAGFEPQTKEVTIAALNHQYSSRVTKPNCAYDGYTKYTCERCGHQYIDDYVPALGHTYEESVIQATLERDGQTLLICSTCGSVEVTGMVIKPYTFKLSAGKYTYNGKVKTPIVTVKDFGNHTLKKGTDYTVEYAAGRKNTGKYTVTIKFKGNYSGTKVLTFKILPGKTSKITTISTKSTIKASWKKVTGASGYRVQLLSSSGKVLKTAHTTKLNYTFKSLKNATTYKVKVTAYKTIDKVKNYSLSAVTLKTGTAPSAPTLKVTAGSKKATLSWKKLSCTGYEIMYDTNSKFSSPDKVTVTKSSTIKKTISNLKKGKTYYFKVRAYRTVNGKKIYGAYSKVVKVKIK